jgi:hypothetical protein
MLTTRQSTALAEAELKAFWFKVAVVCEEIAEGMLAHEVHGDVVSEAIMLIRAPFIQREAFQVQRLVRRGWRRDTRLTRCPTTLVPPTMLSPVC